MLFSRVIMALGLATLFSVGAEAQQTCSTPNYYNSLFHPGCLAWTDLNNAFINPPVIGSGIPNVGNFSNLNLSGNLNLNGTLNVPMSTASAPGIVLAPGVAPSVPPDGSLWVTTTGLFARINGGTVGPFGTGGGGGGGSPGGSTNAIQINSAGSFAGVTPMTNGQLLIGQTGSAPTGNTVSGDATLSNAGALTVTKTNGVNFGSLATLSTATVATGGTGLTAGTNGGIPAFTAIGTMTSSGLLTNNALMLGGGLGATPKVMASLGTTTTVLHGNAAGAPSFGPVSLTSDITGILPPVNMGTGSPSSSNFLRGDGTWQPTSGASSLTITDGTNSVAGTTQVTFNGMIVGGTTPNATATPSAHDNTSVANYALGVTDMGGVRNFNGTNLTMTINAISSTVFAAGMQSTICNLNSTALTISSAVTLNGYTPTTLPGPVQGVAQCLGLTSNGTTIDVAPFHYSASQVFTNVTNQSFTGGFHPTAFSIGTVSSGTTTVDCGNGPFQTITNAGAFTLAMAAFDGSCTVRITNNGSTAGLITPSGFSEGANKGDTPTTGANSDKFDWMLTRIGGNPHFLISALQ